MTKNHSQHLSLMSTLFFVLSLASTVHAQVDMSFGIEPITPTMQNHLDCGIELYAKRDALCGQEFHVKATKACPANGYHVKPNMACPGSVKAYRYKVGNKTKCKAGEKREVKYVKWNHRRGIFKKLTFTSKKETYCNRPNKPKKCQHKSHGIKYKSCQHKSHGFKQFKLCKHPQIQPIRPAKCSLYVNSDEQNMFMDKTKESVQVMTSSKLVHLSSYMRVKKAKKQLACTIKKLSANPSIAEAVEQMTEDYELEFLEGYNPAVLSCDASDAESPVAQIVTECTVVEGTVPGQCEAGLAYLKVNRWFEVLKINLANIKNQANVSPAYQAEIVELSSSIQQ